MPNLFNNQYANLASKGRFGDTMLAHINPQEAGLLKSMGGAGTINPQTGLREFYATYTPPPPQPRAPIDGPSIPQSVLDALPKQLETQTVQVPKGTLGGGFYENTIVVPPPNAIPVTATQFAMGGPREVPTGEYYIPLDMPNYPKTDALGYPVPPLVAKYDASGNLQTITAQTRYFANQNNITIQPEYNLSGQLIATNAADNREGEGGGFGDFLSSAVQDFGPMIALGVGANYLAGSGLLGGAGAAGGATAADIAASKALAQANLSGYAGTAFSAIPSGVGAGLLGSGAAGAGSPLTGFGTGQLGADIAATELASAAIDPLAAANISGGLTTDAVARAAASGGAGSTVTPSMLQSIADKTGISVDTLKTFGPSVIQGLIGAGGSALTANQATDAARTQADAQIRAAQIAADAARFRPVGVTTRFGSSNFKTDAQGNVIGAGYTPSPEILGYQNRLSTLANQGLTDVEGARTAYQPLTGAAQNLFSLGQGYLAPSPEQVAANYISKQTALIAPSRENQLAELRNRQFQTGRSGAATAQGGNLMATNPEMAAYFNAIAQQDLVLAAQADQEAQNRIKFGAGLFDTGANLQGRYYTGQTAAYSPFTTAMDTSSGLERLAQQPLDLSTSIGQKVSTATADVGRLTGQGIINAAGTMAPANAYSLGGNLLSGAANSPVLASAVNKAFGNTPPAQQQYTYDPVSKQFVPVQQFVA